MENKRILIVEDDEDIRRNLQDILESEGYVVDASCDGEKALLHLSEARELPNLILLDLMMPVMDGFRFRQVQELDPKFGSIPVIIMTADGHIEAKGMKIGACDYIRKPVDLDDFLEKIDRFFSSEQ